ncbi:ethanolamine ammonia-lyase reactivating factor EutA, partial [Pseudoramibacter alactolyticus]
MSMEEKIKSVGIDIGTSTTQMIFSELTICNTAGSYVVPRIHIVDKRVVYRSPIYFTPLIGDALIDIEAIEKILRKEYAKAGVAPADLQTGAVIITGDSARKENADIVLQALSDMAGNFVVATAGPSLESVLSAKGAGTDNLSRKKRKVMANIDIGGGTSNIAVFDRGKLIGTTCLDIGGRLVRVEGGRITAVFSKIAELAERRGIPLHVGEPADLQQLERLCEIMADHLFQAVNRQTRMPDHGSLYTNDGAPLPQVLHMDA